MGVFKKKNRWYIDYSLPGGKRKREVVTIKWKRPLDVTRNDALKCLAIRQGQVAEGKFNIIETARNITFDKLCQVYLNDYSKVNKRSWKRDEFSIKALKTHFSGKKISQITPWAVDRYKGDRLKTVSLRKKPVTKATVNREITCLKGMLTYAVGEKWLAVHPLSGYKLFKERPNKTRVVTQEEFRAVYEHSGATLRLIIITAYLTGMRLGEIFALKWENVSLQERHILVADSKNSESRYIPMNEELYEILKRLKEGAASEYVFTGLSYRRFPVALSNAVLRSDVPKFTCHDLRHTFATNLVMSGVDIVTVSELLGHKSLAMTKRYSHSGRDQKREAIERLKSGIVDTSHDTSLVEFKRAGK